MNERELVVLAKKSGFCLGGSRRMAEKFPAHIAVSDSTDWDIYSGDTKEAIDFLDANGFEKIVAENRDYWDSLLLDIYKHKTLRVEALIRSDVKLYTESFESITVGEYIDKLWKSAPYGCALLQPQICDYFNALFERTKSYGELSY